MVGGLATLAGWASSEVLRYGDLCEADWGFSLTPAPPTGESRPSSLKWGMAFGSPRRVAGKVRLFFAVVSDVCICHVRKYLACMTCFNVFRIQKVCMAAIIA